jgi:hypothetical protein
MDFATPFVTIVPSGLGGALRHSIFDWLGTALQHSKRPASTFTVSAHAQWTGKDVQEQSRTKETPCGLMRSAADGM